MKRRFFAFIGAAAAIAAVIVVATVPAAAQAPGPAIKTSWGDPDLQGIWTYDWGTPLQRPAKYAGREFFTDAEIADVEKAIAARPWREFRPVGDDAVKNQSRERDVAGAYNAVYTSVKHLGRRTSLIVDPPDGKIPSFTPEATKMRADM